MTQPDPILSWELPDDLIAVIAEVLIKTPLTDEEIEERRQQEARQAAGDRGRAAAQQK
jgi:hypothetical protein